MKIAGLWAAYGVVTAWALLQSNVVLAKPTTPLDASPSESGAATSKSGPSPEIPQAKALPQPLRGRVEDTRRQTLDRDWAAIEEKTQQFIKQNPQDPRVPSLRKQEVVAAVRAEAQEAKSPASNKSAGLKTTQAVSRKTKTDAFVADQKLSAQDRIEVKTLLQRRALEKVAPDDRVARENARLQNARQLISEFPNDSRGYGQLLALAKGKEAVQSKALAAEITASKAPAGMKAEARRLTEQRDLEGKPLNFPGMVISTFNGKISVLYTWSVKRPEIFESVRRWSLEGVQCIGINTDTDSELARSLVEKTKLPGLQFYDKPGGPISQALKSGSTPAIYIIDQHGILRDTNGYVNTRAKLHQLLKGKGGKS